MNIKKVYQLIILIWFKYVTYFTFIIIVTVFMIGTTNVHLQIEISYTLYFLNCSDTEEIYS